MYLIKNINVLENYCLLIEFTDNTVKKVDISPYLNMGIFVQLKDQNYFQQVKNHGYFISWPNEQDLSADTLYLS